jgi:serine/threonine-protein kinase ULK/ATG1
MIKRNNIRKE